MHDSVNRSAQRTHVRDNGDVREWRLNRDVHYIIDGGERNIHFRWGRIEILHGASRVKGITLRSSETRSALYVVRGRIYRRRDFSNIRTLRMTGSR